MVVPISQSKLTELAFLDNDFFFLTNSGHDFDRGIIILGHRQPLSMILIAINVQIKRQWHPNFSIKTCRSPLDFVW